MDQHVNNVKYYRFPNVVVRVDLFSVLFFLLPASICIVRVGGMCCVLMRSLICRPTRVRLLISMIAPYGNAVRTMYMYVPLSLNTCIGLGKYHYSALFRNKILLLLH